MSSTGTWSTRVLWLLAIWAGSVATLAVVAWLLRLFMHWAGMSAPEGR